MTNRNTPIIVEQRFDTSINKVWEAITELEQMQQWFFDNIPDFKAVVGFETSFPVHSGERRFTHLWTLLEVIPNKKIKYDWRYKEYDGIGFVSFELSEQDGQTLLRLTNEGLSSFPEEISEFARESCEGGWKYFIQENLKNFLAKK